jgi:hypothetical protein
MEPRIVKMAARMVAQTMGGGGHSARELRELPHLARHAWHHVKEDWKFLFEEDERE